MLSPCTSPFYRLDTSVVIILVSIPVLSRCSVVIVVSIPVVSSRSVVIVVSIPVLFSCPVVFVTVIAPCVVLMVPGSVVRLVASDIILDMVVKISAAVDDSSAVEVVR